MFRSIILDGKTIDYKIIRKNVKHINILVGVDGSVCVSANDNVSLDDIEKHLIKRTKRIFNLLNKFEKKREDILFTYILGKKIPITLETVEPSKASMFFDGKEIHIKRSKFDNVNTIKMYVKKIVDRLSEDVLREHFDKGFEKCKKIVYAKPKIYIKPLIYYWGLCTPATYDVVLNKYLVMMPKECIELVVIHEFCHFASGDHNEKFYETLAAYLPDWEQREKLLIECTHKIFEGIVPVYREVNLHKNELIKFY